MKRQRPAVLWILAGGFVAYLLFFQTTFLVPDSSGTYAWSRSLLFDQDVDFENEFARLGSIPGDESIRFHALTGEGRPGNPFGMGSGLLWAPFVAMADAELRLTGSRAEPPGYSRAHVLAASTGTVIYGLAALMISFVVARRFAPQSAAAWAVAGVALGSSFLAYLFHLPTYSHVPAAFAGALVLIAGLEARRRLTPWAWLLAGSATGFATLVRAQSIAWLALLLALWLSTWRTSRPTAAKLGNLAAMGAGFAGVFSFQLLAWWRIYGTPWQVPQGEGFLDLMHPHLGSLFFSPWNGLFPWAPLLLLAVPGIFFLARKDPFLGAGLAAVVLAQAWLAASVPDWWAGYSVGARRLVDLTPVFILSLACTFAWLGERSGNRGRSVLVGGLCAAGIIWNLLLTLQVQEKMLRPHLRIGWDELLAGQLQAVGRLPGYLGSHLARWGGDIRTVIHRDSSVPFLVFEQEPSGVLALVLVTCWLVGAGVLLVFFSLRDKKATMRGNPGDEPNG